MKKLFLVMLAVGGMLTAGAQNVAGPIWIGGNAGFNSSSPADDISSTNINIGPQVGYMLNERLGVGITLDLSFSNMTDNTNANNEVKMSTNQMTFSPFARYYFPITDNFAFFGQAQIDIAMGSSKTEDQTLGTTSEGSISGFGIGVMPGVEYWFTPAWSMNATLGGIGYGSLTTTNKLNDTESKSSSFGLSGNFWNMGLGLYYHF